MNLKKVKMAGIRDDARFRIGGKRTSVDAPDAFTLSKSEWRHNTLPISCLIISFWLHNCNCGRIKKIDVGELDFRHTSQMLRILFYPKLGAVK